MQQGFAVLSSDAGHSAAVPDFGVDPQARLDYGCQAVAKLTPMAKSAIKTVYVDPGSTGIIFQVPPANPVGFNPLNFALTTDLDALYAGITATNATYTGSAMSFMTPPNPTRMQGLRERGGKIMVYQGVSDSIFSFTDTEAWYKGVQKDTGTDFARLYPVPGMGHCNGGPATGQFDLLTPLVNWVEKGIVPQEGGASARGAGNAGGVNSDVPAAWAADWTRPLCTYPKVARYKGSGSTELAGSFSCE